MRTILLFVFFLCIGNVADAQSSFDIEKANYAIIKDTDDFVNIRVSPSNSAAIVGKIYKYTIFNCQPTKTNWWKIESFENDKHYPFIQGYIYKDRVLFLSHWQNLKNYNVYPKTCLLKNDSIVISVKKAVFDPKKHKLLYQAQSGLRFIDGKKFEGTDGELPKNFISSVNITKNGVPIVMPKKAFSDLYEPKLNMLSMYSAGDNTLYIKMINSDGAGSYTVIWVIKDNKYYARYIDTSFA